MVASFGQRALPLYSKLLNNIPKKFTCLRGNLKTAVDALTLVMDAAQTADVGLVVPVCQSLIQGGRLRPLELSPSSEGDKLVYGDHGGDTAMSAYP